MAEILGGLALLGTVITNKLGSTDEKTDKKKIDSKTSGNIYNSNKLHVNRDKMQSLADDKWEKAKHPEKTNVIPKYYNRTKHGSDDNDSTFSDDCSDGSSVVSNDKPLYEKGQELISKNRTVEHFLDTHPSNRRGRNRSLSDDTDTFLNQFTPMAFNNPTDPVAQNKIPEQVGNISRLSLERDLSLQGGYSQCDDKMTYGVVPSSQMTHNNMQPDFRPKKGYGYNIDEHRHINDISQRKLDLFTGSLNNLEYKPKTERKPLFNPMIGLTHIYGAPVMTSEYESRFIPSREKRNQKPFQETRVTPGLNLGYNEVGKQGYHDSYRAFDKTVNELRTPNHAKVSYTTPVIHQMKGSRQPIIPVVPKRRPITFEEWGTKRMLQQYNAEFSAPTVYGEYDPKNLATVNRGTQERVTYGPAQFSYTLSTPESLQPLVHDSTKENFEADGPRNTTMVQAQQARGFNESWNAPMTQRMQPNEYIGPAFHQNSNKMYAFNTLDNVPDPTMRSIHENTDRYGFVGNAEYAKPQAFDEQNAVPDPNMRTIHSEYNRAGNGVGQSQYYKPQAFDAVNAVPDPNMRTIHSEYNRAGNGIGQSQYYKPQAFDAANAIPDPNMRTIHSEYDRAGNGIGQSQYYKPQAFDATNAVPDPNMRTIHSEYDRAGNGIGQSQYYKPQAFDAANAVPDPNMRTIHSEYDRAGNGVGQSQYYKPQAFDAFNAAPDPTMRDIHQDTDRVGFIGNSQYHKPQAFDAVNAVPDPNMRTIHSEYDRAGNGVGQSQYYKPQAFDAFNAIPDPTMRDIHQNTDRAGFIGNSQFDKTFVFDMTSNIPDPTMREIHIDNNHTGPLGFHEAQTGRGDVRNAYINVTKEPLTIGRAPTTCNYNKCPSMEGTMVQLCDNIQINRDIYPDIAQQITPKMPTMYTRSSHELPNDEWHFNSYVTDNLQGNQFINNTQHRSVTKQ